MKYTIDTEKKVISVHGTFELQSTMTELQRLFGDNLKEYKVTAEPVVIVRKEVVHEKVYGPPPNPWPNRPWKLNDIFPIYPTCNPRSGDFICGDTTSVLNIPFDHTAQSSLGTLVDAMNTPPQHYN